jgi:hypothetical protein
MTPIERASRYVEALPIAISGSRGHDALFRVVCVLVNGFAFSDEQAWPILLEYNARCLPPWSERELRHKLDQAHKASHQGAHGHLLGTSTKCVPTQHADGLPRMIGRIPLPNEPAAELPVAAAAHDSEAHRIAGELLKLHHDGALSGPADREAAFYACLLRDFGATYCGILRACGQASSLKSK